MYKGKGKFRPRTSHEGPEGEQRYSSTLSLTSALDGVGCQRYILATLPPGKTRYPLYRRLGRPQSPYGQVRRISPHWDSIPGPSSPYRVAILTELSRPCSLCIMGEISVILKTETERSSEQSDRIIQDGVKTQKNVIGTIT